jgi:hypothetical protein
VEQGQATRPEAVLSENPYSLISLTSFCPEGKVESSIVTISE